MRAGRGPAYGAAVFSLLTAAGGLRDDRSKADEPFDLLDLLQITDRSFPTGGFVHSHGLEWILKQRAASLEEVLEMRLQQQLARFELVFLLAAMEWATDPETNPLAALDERFHSMVLAREAREASAQVGRQLLRNAADLFESKMLSAAATGLPYAHAPVVFGAISHSLRVPPRTATRAYAFQTVRSQISAAQRLSRLGQAEAQRILHHAKPGIEAAVSVALACPIEDAAVFMPLLDIASMAHERAEVRLFVS